MFKNEGIEIDNKIDEESIHRLGSNSKELEDSIDHQDFNKDLYKSRISEENTDKIHDMSAENKSLKKSSIHKNNEENKESNVQKKNNNERNLNNIKENLNKDTYIDKDKDKDKNKNKNLPKSVMDSKQNENLNSKKSKIEKLENTKSLKVNIIEKDKNKTKSKSNKKKDNLVKKEMNFTTVFKPDTYIQKSKDQDRKLGSNRGLIYNLYSNTSKLKIGSNKNLSKSGKKISLEKNSIKNTEERQNTSFSKSKFNKTGEIPSFKQKINFKNNERYSLYLKKSNQSIKANNQTVYNYDKNSMNKTKHSNKSPNEKNYTQMNASEERFFKKHFEPFYNYNSTNSYVKPLKTSKNNLENKNNSSREKQEIKLTETDYINDFNSKLKRNKLVSSNKDKVDKIKSLLYNSKNPYSVCWIENNLIEKYNCKISFSNFIGGYPVFKLVKNDNNKSNTKPVSFKY